MEMTGAGVSVLIPFGGDDPWRRTLFEWVVRRWTHLLPECELVVGRSQHPFNRSAARNDAAARATGDVFVFADADVIVQQAAIRQLLDTGAWGFPFDVYYTMDQPWTETVVQFDPTLDSDALTNEPDADSVIHRHPGEIAAECVSGCLVVPRLLYEKAGPWDEAFGSVWGGEDNAFALVLRRLAVDPVRVHANALHMHHSTEGANFDHPGWPANQRRLLEYQKGRLGRR